MYYKKMLLSKISKKAINSKATLEIYLNEYNEELPLCNARPAMLVIPGGAYEWCSNREGEPVALRYMAEGFNCFVLKYATKQKYPTPHNEVAIAINYINKHCKKFNLIKNCVSLVGFSAGGHLCASYGYCYPELAENLKLSKSSIRPFSINLAYPVIKAFGNTNEVTINNIAGDDLDLKEKMSAEKHVSKKYPPVYIWTTKEDTCVPPENTYEFIEALKANKVKYKADIYEYGVHGGSLVNQAVYPLDFDYEKINPQRNWPTNSAKFIYGLIK